MPPVLSLIVYSVCIVAASLAGGWVTVWFKLSHTRLQIVISFVAGLMLGIGLLHMLPHSVAYTHSLDRTLLFALFGLLAMFFLIRVFDFHHHGEAEHEHEHHGESCRASHRFSWVGVAIGLSLHTAIDGIALAAAVMTESGAVGHDHGGMATLGLGTFLVILLHKPLDALSITSLMAASGWSTAARQATNAGFAMMCPLGALLFFFGFSGNPEIIGAALAFAAGTFICISLADLLPELQFHTHDRGKLSVALLLGVALAYGIGLLEGENHGGIHQHGGEVHAEGE
ncbi:MAG: ZIP family metal transporter [Pirellulales bacterium]|nr:ZIP family metal transporter [Pirellulales bacterium]